MLMGNKKKLQLENFFAMVGQIFVLVEKNKTVLVGQISVLVAQIFLWWENFFVVE